VAASGDAFGAQDVAPCGVYGAPVTSTLSGGGFDAWEGLPVQGCLHTGQVTIAEVCGASTVTGGEFTLTKSECFGEYWTVVISAPDQSGIVCGYGRMLLSTVTPADCTCFTTTGPDPDPDHVPSTGCTGGADGGARTDAVQDSQDGS
jgi:hypothetical protein